MRFGRFIDDFLHRPLGTDAAIVPRQGEGKLFLRKLILNLKGYRDRGWKLMFAGLLLVNTEEASAQNKKLISAEGLEPALSIYCILEDEGSGPVINTGTSLRRPIDYFSESRSELVGDPIVPDRFNQVLRGLSIEFMRGFTHLIHNALVNFTV